MATVYHLPVIPSEAPPPRESLIEETAATLTQGGHTPDYALTLGSGYGWPAAVTSALESAMADAGVAAILRCSP